MPKFCSCFKANNDDRKKQNIDVESNENGNNNFGLILTGDDQSGRRKIIEELVALYNPFTRKDKILKTSEIERYIRDSLTDILRAFEQSHPTFQLEYPENQQSINYILTTAHKINFDYPIEFFQHVEILCTDAGLQEFVEETRFPISAIYFLDRVNKIRDPDYIPTTEDMIHSRLCPSQMFKMSFETEKEGMHFNLLEIDFLHKEQEELIKSFRNKLNTIIFITDCSSFDVISDEKSQQTQLHQSLDLYKTIRNNKWLKTAPCILLLNKQDLLAKKIKHGIRLEDYFPDFATYILSDVDAHRVDSDKDPEVVRAKFFIEDQFMKINPNNCYRHFTCNSDICFRLIYDDCHTISQKMVLKN